MLLINLAHVPFCDLRGLSSLVRSANRADRAGCRYGLLAAQPQVVSLLRLTGLDQRLPVFATAAARLSQEATLAPSSKGGARLWFTVPKNPGWFSGHLWWVAVTAAAGCSSGQNQLIPDAFPRPSLGRALSVPGA